MANVENEEKSITGRFIADIRCSKGIDADDVINAISDAEHEALIKLATRFSSGKLVYKEIVIVTLPSKRQDSLLCACRYQGGGETFIGIGYGGYTHS